MLEPNPLLKASRISKILFSWMLPFLKKGFRDGLDTGDLFEVLPEYKANVLSNALKEVWAKEVEQSSVSGNKPSLFKALVKMAWRTFTLATILYAVNQCVIVVSQPILLRLLIASFNDETDEDWKRWMYAGGISLLIFLNTLSLHPAVLMLMRLGMKLRVAVSSLIYRKTLKLNQFSRNETSSGQLVNLLSNDCNRFDTTLHLLPFILTAPILFVLLTYLLFQEIGVASLPGAVFIVVLLPLHYYVGKLSAQFRLKIAEKADERGSLMNEIICGMRFIKQYTWEMPFSDRINKIRRLEINQLKKVGYLRGVHQAMFSFSSKLVQFLILLAYFYLNQDNIKGMPAEKVFFILTCVNTACQITIHLMPQAAAMIGELRTSIMRIEKFLLLKEQDVGAAIKSDERLECVSENDRVFMKEVQASWDGKRAILENVSFALENKKLVIIVGPVGSSKSSILNAFINELMISSGICLIKGNISYASQEAWIFAGSVRQNILFGFPYDEERYKMTLMACALEKDLEQLSHGDYTIIGDRGVSLSGGQKARVSLARTVYRKADVYLLDDPLSAVDAAVGRHIFENCIQGQLSNCTRVLVTHQLQYLQYADHIIVLNEGKVAAQGTFQELLQENSLPELVGAIEGDLVKEMLPLAQPAQINMEQNEAKINSEQKESKEIKSSGSISAKVYWEYLTSGNPVCCLFAFVIILITPQPFITGMDWWLSVWSASEAKKNETTNSFEIYKMDTNSDEHFYIYVLTGLAAFIVISCLFRGIGFYIYCVRISSSIHTKIFKSVIHAPIKFFDETPSGRIMNRFTQDISTIDELLPPALIDTIAIFLQILGVVIIIVISNHILAAPAMLLFIALFSLRKVFVRISRDLKRIEAINKSPLFNHVTTTLEGLTTIRAFNQEEELTKQFEGHQDIHSSSWFLYITTTRCFAFWLEITSNVFFAVVTFSFLLYSTEDGSKVGLAISSLISIMGSLQWGMRQSAETENYMTSVERALEYSRLEQECDMASPPGIKQQEWPSLGSIKFNKVFLSYEKKQSILKNLSFEINPGEKVGLVGRTGAGKSSIVTALFRLTELCSGDIYVGGVNVKEIGLHDLRKNISVIPQDPVLFAGNIRANLDPFGEFCDSDLMKVIEEVELKEVVQHLDFLVEKNGGNLSTGEKQLVCLARVILRKNKILILDEATANIDLKTDEQIQETITRHFSSSTVITIAHRIQSVISCDRVLVMKGGILKECDHPHNLLQIESGIFAEMVKQTGEASREMLKLLAEKAYIEKNLEDNGPPHRLSTRF